MSAEDAVKSVRLKISKSVFLCAIETAALILMSSFRNVQTGVSVSSQQMCKPDIIRRRQPSAGLRMLGRDLWTRINSTVKPVL